MCDTEDDLPEPPELTTINKENVDHKIANLNEVLGNKKNIDKKVKLNYINKKFPKNIQKFQEQEAILGERNSYSKTDKESTFMRTKEDHMGNRIIEINTNLNRLKQQAFQLLNSEQGIAHRDKRCYDVEPVFRNIKHNHSFKRFMLGERKKWKLNGV